jgi:hypothetical protein
MRIALGVPLLASLLVVQAPTLDNVLSRAGEWVTTFHRDFPLVVAEEAYTQMLRNYGVASGDLAAMGAAAGESSGQKVRRMRSEFALVPHPGGTTWDAFRDAYEVDGKPLREQRNRLQHLLTDAPATPLAEARRLSNEAAQYNLGLMKRNVNVPMFALMTLVPASQRGFAFTKKGEKTVAGVHAWVVAFTETQRPTLATTPDARPLPMRGELWIDPANGRVLHTLAVWDSLDAFAEMKQKQDRYSQFPRIQIEVTYGLDPALNIWVPTEMKELYDRQIEVVTCTATYSAYRPVHPGSLNAPIRDE